MNRGLLFGVLLFLMGVQSVVNAQELSVSDIKCYLVHNEKYIGNDGIALYKDGSDLRVELSYYQCNPFMTGFDITPTMKCGSNDELDSVSVSVLPKVPDSYRNTNVLQQWYHVAFTIHGVESRSLYFSCLWFEGQVNLKEQQYIVLRDPGVAVTIGDVDFYIYEAKHFAALYNGKSASGDVAIPSEVSYEGKEYPVKAIMSQAFKGCGTLTSVTIPNSVIAIEYEAFSGCTNLWTINNGLNVEIVRPNAFSGTPWYNNQPDGIVYLGKAVCACKGNLPEGTNLTIKEGTMSISPYAFMSCKGLTSITIPEGVTIIEASTFSSCSNLVSVRLPESLTIIDREAFRECNRISSIHIPSHIKYICGGAFRDCRSLTSANVPEGVENIEQDAFYGCNNMTAITLPESLKNIDGEAFYNCKSLTSVRIPDNVEEIGEGTFTACVKLNSLILSEKLRYIGASAFYSCSDLSTIVCNALVPPRKSPYATKTGGYLSTDVFYNVNKQNCKLYVPEGCEEAYRAAELWKDFNIMEMGTGINEMRNEGVRREKYTNEIYDLQGRKLSQAPQKGVYIQNGKKVAIK